MSAEDKSSLPSNLLNAQHKLEQLSSFVTSLHQEEQSGLPD